MTKYFLTSIEDTRLRSSIWLKHQRRSLYEYLCELPIEKLEKYPQKGYHWWMGRAARSKQALELRDYVLFWRRKADDFRQYYHRGLLESLSHEELQKFLRTYLTSVPPWAYEGPIRDALQILFQHANLA